MIHSDSLIDAHKTADTGQRERTELVGEFAQDAQREQRIQHHREQMEAAMREYEASGCIDAKGKADWHRIQFEREIAARSPEQKSRMAAEQRERMRREPGATQ